ncbi:PepSY domain-containing protein [Pseudoalteromonas spongiae]|uniref:PepSY domain-containing protein n=1 Tax=Pseudoalteromonas spongiae TaxID=298657 RepID=UPI00026CCD85|nr:PepSY domain-containing protein [Pseudoalteromonas spongiae]ATD00527.1 hypothetical protein PSPO_b0518 [Pseudoalteromonas spongiae UST010723-006]
MIKSFLVWHKRFALFACVPFMLWAASGLLHPFMSHFTKAERIIPQPVTINSAAIAHYVPLDRVLEKHAIFAFSHASLVDYQNRYYYQISQNVNGELHTKYFDIETAELSHDLSDAVYAEYLATKWSGKTTRSIHKLTTFTFGYSKINRILPVYKMELADKSLIYIDTLGKRIAAHNTPLRESVSYWFGQLHTFSFLGNTHDLTRIVPMLVISVSLFLMALSGVVAYSLLWRKIKDTRYSKQRLHRLFGISLSVCLLGFSTSSMHILIDKLFPETFRQIVPSNTLSSKQLKHDPINSLRKSGGHNFQLVNIHGEMISQIVHFQKRSRSFSYWQQSQLKLNDLALVETILAQQLNLSAPIETWQKVDKFGPSYAFINKRLPVVQVTFDNDPTIYSVEVHTGYIAAIDTPWQQARSWHFGYLHKYHFLNPIGKGLRDSIITLIIIALLSTTILGLLLYISRYKRRATLTKRRSTFNQINN